MDTTTTVETVSRQDVQQDQLNEMARVLVVDDNQLRGSGIGAALKAGRDITVIVTPPENPVLASELLPADLVLLALGGRQPTALGTGALAMQRNPYAEVVFYCDEPDAPEVAAASVLGITRIVSARDIAAWLTRAGDLLARGALLRRLAAAAIEAVPPPPVLRGAGERAVQQPLPAAEMQFRETYIRYLLSQSGSRQEAARRAGVPYRTMCEMIRKLGIAAE